MELKVAGQPTQEFDIDPAESVYVIGVGSRLVRLPIWTLRMLDREGVDNGKRRGGRDRQFSLQDVRRLILSRRESGEQGVNGEGDRVILSKG